MPQFDTRRRVRHSAVQMFDLVADVEKYPRFVPLCQSLVIRDEHIGADGLPVVIADMTVAYKVFKETFASRITKDSGNTTIVVDYLDGPFSRMHNTWQFEPTSANASTVVFSIDYAFRARALELLMGAMFDTAFRKFALAFEARADAVYGVNETDGSYPG